MDKKQQKKSTLGEKAAAGVGVGAFGVAANALKNYLIGDIPSVPAAGATLGEYVAYNALKNSAEIQAAANRAKIGAALGSKVGTAAGLGLVGGAAGLGAMAIRNAKKKFDKEIDKNTTETMKGWDDIMNAIKVKNAKKKVIQTPVGGGASPELTNLSKEIYKGNNYVGGGASPALTNLSKELYNRKPKTK